MPGDKMHLAYSLSPERESVVSALNALRSALAATLLAPGNLVCDLLGVTRDNTRELMRMLVNALFWICVGLFVALGVA
jgi:hypothetical protein